MAENNSPQPTINVPPLAQRPVLKESCDVAIQTAFHESNWNLAYNLAKQRSKSTKDPYYAALEIAAKSQGENISDRIAGLDTVLEIVSDKDRVIKDVDYIDLYEFALSPLSLTKTKYAYSDTIGVLRSRAVRALPKDRNMSLRCLTACLYNADWLHAQEITVSMEKNFPEDSYRIPSIFATHMYSKAPTCPAKSADLLTMIAKRKGDKEFESRGLVGPADTAPALALTLSDQQAWLWLELQASPQANPKDTIAALHKNALRLVDCGFNDTLILVLKVLKDLKAWEEISQICVQIIEKATIVSQREAVIIDELRVQLAQERKLENKKNRAEKKSEGGNTDSAQDQPNSSTGTDGNKEDKEKLEAELERLRPQRSEIELIYFTLGTEQVVWNALIKSVKEKEKEENLSQSLKQTRKIFDKLHKSMVRSGEAKDLDHSRYDRAILEILFLREAQSAPSEAVSNTRVQHLVSYLANFYWDVSAFDNAKTFIEKLKPVELRSFFDKLDNEVHIAHEAKHKYKALTIIGTGLKARYLLASSTKDPMHCKCCDRRISQDLVCVFCYASIVGSALKRYREAICDMEFRRDVLPLTNGDPLSELAMVGSLGLLQLARVKNSRQYRRNQASPLYSADIQYLFQAIVWLDSYLTAWPKNDPLRMLLVKLYLLIGCVSRALSLWDKFDVKNVVLDSLGSLCFDRISTFAPGLFANATGHSSNAMKTFLRYYDNAIRANIPKKIVDAFHQQSWQSIPDMFTFSENLKRSCTLVMAVVEERRGERVKTGKSLHDIGTDPLVSNLTLAHTLKDNTDLSYLPNFGGKDAVPTQVLVSHGPSLSSARAHLSLQAERFIDLVSYIQPRDYKPSKVGIILQADQKFASDMSIHVGRLVEEVLKETELTLPEVHYYRIILKLSKLVVDLLSLYCLVPQPSADSRTVIESSIKDVLVELKEQSRNFLDVPATYTSKLRGFHGFVALHAMGMLRESALVIKLTASYLTAAMDKVKAADKVSRSHAEMTWASNQLKTLTTDAAAAEKQIEHRIKGLKELVQGGGWIDRLHAWTFADSTHYTSLESREVMKMQKEFRESLATDLKSAIGGNAAFERWAGTVVESWQDLVNGWSAVKFG